MAATVTVTPVARAELESAPLVIRSRINAVFERLSNWPAVSGVKPLCADLRSSYRIRTGDYRILFTVDQERQAITVRKIGNRRTV